MGGTGRRWAVPVAVTALLAVGCGGGADEDETAARAACRAFTEAQRAPRRDPGEIARQAELEDVADARAGALAGGPYADLGAAIREHRTAFAAMARSRGTGLEAAAGRVGALRARIDERCAAADAPTAP